MSEKIECIAVVKTPLQLINASEYIHKHNIKGYLLIVMRNRQKWGREFFDNVPSIKLWENVVFFDFNSGLFLRLGRFKKLKHLDLMLDDLRFKRFLKSQLSNASSCRTLVVGNPRDLWVGHLANTIEAEEIVDCEDGMTTLVQNYNRSIIWKFRENLFGFKSRNAPIDKIFTSYEEFTLDGKEIIVNKYDFVRSLIKGRQSERSEIVWFIGQPLVELDLLSFDLYLKVVSEIKGRCEGNEFFYYPHPGENSEKVKALSSKLGVDVITPDSVLEVAVMKSQKTPQRMAFLYSSAFSTFQTIYGEDIRLDVYKPDYKYFKSKMKAQAYEDVYGWLEGFIKPPHRFIPLSNLSE